MAMNFITHWTSVAVRSFLTHARSAGCACVLHEEKVTARLFWRWLILVKTKGSGIEIQLPYPYFPQHHL